MTDAPSTPPQDPPEAPPEDSNGLPADLDPHIRRLLDRANTEAAHFRHEARNREAELAELRKAHESEQERTVREAEERGRKAAGEDHAKVVADYERRLATLAITAKAAGRFADPEDAVRLLDLEQLLGIGDAGKRDKAVDEALGALLKAKPYLARKPEAPGKLVTQGGRSQPPDGRPRERSWLRG